jgi:hypothetical protein
MVHPNLCIWQSGSPPHRCVHSAAHTRCCARPHGQPALLQVTGAQQLLASGATIATAPGLTPCCALSLTITLGGPL